MAVAEAHVAELEDFVAEPNRHLRAAWGRGVPLLVIGEDSQRMVIDTILDLEILHVHHSMVRARQRGGGSARLHRDT